LTGHDGVKVEQLLATAQREGAAVLADITRRAVTRWLVKGPQALLKADTLYDAQERQDLADALAATNSTANLLGRSRIRLRQQAAEKAHGIVRHAEDAEGHEHKGKGEGGGQFTGKGKGGDSADDSPKIPTATHDVHQAIINYVGGTATDKQKEIVARVAQESTTQQPALLRISKEDQKHRVGDEIHFKQPASFSGRVGDLLEGKSAGSIGWKSSDAALYLVEKPSRGLDIDYRSIRTKGFGAAEEQETVLAGKYRVKEVRKVTEPGTLPQYGYTVPQYVLTEIGSPGSVKHAETPEGTLSPSAGPAIHLNLPALTQAANYTCGAVALESICRYFNVGPLTETDFARLLQSDPENGTPPDHIGVVARSFGLEVESRSGMTLDDLTQALDDGSPVIVAIQAWGTPEFYPANWSGHYVVAIGYDAEHVYFMDPELEDARGYLTREDFDQRWHDEDGQGNVYDHFGMVFSKPETAEEIFAESFADEATPWEVFKENPLRPFPPEKAVAYFRGLVPQIGGVVQGTTDAGQEVQFISHPSAQPDEVMVQVDPARLDVAFAKDADYYLPPGVAAPSERPGGRAGVEDFLRTGKPLQAPRASLDANGALSFIDGRHRFAVLRDAGVDQVGVMVPVEQVALFRQAFGAVSRGVNPALFGATMRREAFTLAASTDDIVLQKVKQVIQGVLETGEGLDAHVWIQRILDGAGVAPKNPQYSEAVFRTELLESYRHGSQEELAEVADDFPVYRYAAVSGPNGLGDGRNRPTHLAKHNRYYPSSVQFTTVRGTDVGDVVNCRCDFIPVYKATWKKLQEAGARLETSW
jgi:predicted double-glycine peptidase